MKYFTSVHPYVGEEVDHTKLEKEIPDIKPWSRNRPVRLIPADCHDCDYIIIKLGH
jgi:hypothetical protein